MGATTADAEAHLSTDVDALARLERSRPLTLVGALSEPGMVAYSVGRSLLIATIGAIMCSAAGALLRARRDRCITAMPELTQASRLPALHSKGAASPLPPRASHRQS
jgi:hypothetical protein